MSPMHVTLKTGIHLLFSKNLVIKGLIHIPVKTSDIISRRFGVFMTPLSRVQMRIKLTNASSREREKAFRDNWFNSTYSLNISKEDLVDLLNVSTEGQLFQFNGALYEQTDGVAIGTPSGLC